MKIALLWGKYDDIVNESARIGLLPWPYAPTSGCGVLSWQNCADCSPPASHCCRTPPRVTARTYRRTTWGAPPLTAASGPGFVRKMGAHNLSTSSKRDEIIPWKSNNSVCARYVVTKYQKIMLKIMKYNGCRSCWLKKSLLNDPVDRNNVYPCINNINMLCMLPLPSKDLTSSSCKLWSVCCSADIFIQMDLDGVLKLSRGLQVVLMDDKTGQHQTVPCLTASYRLHLHPLLLLIYYSLETL